MHMLTKSFVLLLWTQTLTFVKCQDCTRQQFVNSNNYDQNFDISGMSETYVAGKQVRVPCNTGYTGFYKLICTEGKWRPVGSKCEAKSCGHPGDAQFADFHLQNGEDFVFGSQVAYTCHQGYYMVSRSNIRRCVADGWDGVIPVCDAIKCSVIHVKDNVQMIGDPEEATFGNVIRFTCKHSSEVLSGSAEMYCTENGDWKGTIPECKEVSCPIPVVQHGRVDGGRQEYKENELLLNFQCDAGYQQTDKRYSKCSKSGDRAEWIPTPACKLITCELSLPPMTGTRYNIQSKNVFLPGDEVQVTCVENYWIQNTLTTAAVVTCKDDGEWNTDPVCREVTCSDHLPKDHLSRPVNAWMKNKLGDRVRYDCAWGFKRTGDDEYATCTRDGWTPKPLCKATSSTCPSPELENAEITWGEKTWRSYYSGDQVQYRCRTGAQNSFYATCEEGTWTGTTGCVVKKCPGPIFENAEIIRGAKYNYYDGDRVIYQCRKGVQKPFTATCEDGTWVESTSCLVCTKPVIPNGFAVAPFNDSVIYYSCSENFKLFTKSWWAEATCVNGVWSDLHQCIEQGSCGEAPVIPNGRVERVNPPGPAASLRIVCNKGYRAGINQLTCLNGAWNSQGVELETICSRVGKFCITPPHVENAIITKPNQKEYSSGSSVTYQCRQKYRTKTEDTITCRDGEWEQKNIICVISCDILKDVKLTVRTSDVKEKYIDEETVNYDCNAAKTEGMAMCFSGTWEKTVDCPDITCEVGVLSPGLRISGTPLSNNRVTSGQKLSFLCGDEYDLEGSAETECLETGQWSPPLPTCSKKCQSLQLPEGVKITSPTGGYSRSQGQKITFGCRQTGHAINGNEMIECLENGKWSSQPPTCERRRGCASPPTLNNGDTVDFTKPAYENGERVKYLCFDKYVMEGGPTKTCNNGAWTGTIRCLKPCTVNEEMMNERNIQFYYGDRNKLYAPHKDHLTFDCKYGTSPVDPGPMRRQCLDGVMELPICQ